MPKKPIVKEYPRLIEKVYEHRGVKVGVRIDFREKEISLIECDGKSDKKYLFANRGLKYMGAWLVVLDAMKYAITDAQAILREYTEGLTNEAVDMAIEVEKHIRGKK